MMRRLFPLAGAALVTSALILVLPAATLAGSPDVSTTNAEVFGDTATSVFGVVNPEGETTTYHVAYSLQSSSWCTSGGTSGSPTFTTTPVQMVNSSVQYESVGAQLTGLTLDSAYCAELIASNASGTIHGGQVAWWQGKPRIDNTDASPTGLSTAVVEADVNPGGQSLAYEVLYGPAGSSWCTSGGTSGSPPNATAYTDVGSTDNSFHHVSVNLTGLTPGNEYCAELLVFGNSYLQTYGNQVTWSESFPDAETFDTYSTGPSAATVEGDVNPAGDATTTYQVQYDVASSGWCASGGSAGSPAHTSSPTAAGLDTTQTSYQFVSVDLTGLTEGSDYCAQVIATNSNGEVGGGQVTWTQGAPFADTFEIDPTGNSTATFDGDVNPAGKATDYEVQYDVASSQWCESGGSSGSPANSTASTLLGFTDGTFHEVLVGLAGLSQSTTYCAAIVATNVDGTAESFQEYWTQPTPPPPPVTLSVHVQGAGTVTSSPAGISCSSTCSAPFAPGTAVTLTASGGTFVRWGGAFSCLPPPGKTPSPTCTVTANADMAVTAFFTTPPPSQLPTHVLTVVPSGIGTGTGTVTSSPSGLNCGSTCSVAFAEGTTVTLTATSDPGSRFLGWFGDGCSGTGTCTVTMAADQTVTATFDDALRSPACKVPKLRGKKLAAAKAAIKSAHCAVGKITRTYSAKVRQGRVISQKPAPGTRHPAGTRVRLVVSKGRRPA